MSVSSVSKITSKGQVTIPEPIRGALKLQPGDRLEWQTRPDGVIELRRLSNSFLGLVGILGKPKKRMTIEEMDTVIKQKFGRDNNG